MKNLFSIALVACLLSLNALQPTALADECHDKWSAWLEKYASNSPLEAFNKTSSAPLQKEILEGLLSDPDSLAFDAALRKAVPSYAKVPHADPQVAPGDIEYDLMAQIRDVVVWGSFNAAPRDKLISSHLQSLVEARRGSPDSRRLLIIYAGASHTEDYFLLHPEIDLIHATAPLSEMSHQSSDEYIRYQKAMLVEPTEEDLRELRAQLEKLKKYLVKDEPDSLLDQQIEATEKLISNYEIFLKRAGETIGIKINPASIREKIYTKLADFRMQSQGLTAEKADQILNRSKVDLSSNSVLLISDIHALNTTVLSDDLPDGVCLKGLGYDGVDFALEGNKFGESFDPEVERKTYSVDAEKSIPALEKKHPEIVADIRAGKVLLYPNLIGFLNKLKKFESEGVSVSYTGIE